MTTKKCSKCGEVKSLTDYFKDNRWNTFRSECRVCLSTRQNKYNNTEKGYLHHKYNQMKKTHHGGMKKARLLTLEELFTAFEKHKKTYGGMKSAWGPGVDNLEQHLPITIFLPNNPNKKAKRIGSNLSIDRLNNNIGYTVQNIIFIRSDENSRKRDTTYEDCLIQIRLHEERFIQMKAI